jgi:hypothetical protein
VAKDGGATRYEKKELHADCSRMKKIEIFLKESVSFYSLFFRLFLDIFEIQNPYLKTTQIQLNNKKLKIPLPF